MIRRSLSKFWFLPLLLVFWNLNYTTFWNPDEGRYATASLDMAFPIGGDQPDWLVPHLNEAVRLNKPPLVYWLAAASFRVFGVSEFSGRLPAATACFLVGIILFFWGKRAYDLRAGQCAALVWITLIFPFAMGHVHNTDMLLTFAIALSAFGIWSAMRNQEEAAPLKAQWGPGMLAGVGMALALLAKGPVGVALPLGIGFFYLCLTRGWGRAPWLSLGTALVVALSLGLPWFLAVEAREPGFLHKFLFEENLGRFSGGKSFHDTTPIYFYLPVLLLGLLPWTGFLFATAGSPLANVGEGRARTFALVWACLIVGLFSLSSTKLVSYVLPAFPPLALLIGVGSSRWPQVPTIWRRLTLASTGFIYLTVIVALSLFLLDNRTLPRDEALPIMIGLSAFLLLATVALVIAARLPTAKRTMLVQVGTASLLFLALGPIANRIARYEDGSVFFKELAPQLQPEDMVIGFNSFLPTVIYYTRRPVYFFGFKNTSGLRDAELIASPYFVDYKPGVWRDDTHQREELAKLMQGKRAYVWTKGPMDEPKPRDLHLWGRNNDFFFYSNQKKPEGFVYDFVAPGKRNKSPRVIPPLPTPSFLKAPAKPAPPPHE